VADHDELLHGDFAAYRSALIAAVEPAGPAAVRSTVRRRRRMAVAATGALALALVAAPVVGYAALNRDGSSPPLPAGSADPVPNTGAPTPTATPSATASPTTGRIDRADLLTARLDLPAWGPDGSCPTEGVRLVDGEGDVGDVRLENATRGVRYIDVDGDGTAETIAVLECLTRDLVPPPQQVVAFDRDATGRIVTIGQVAHPNTDQPEWFRSLEVRPDGSVRIEVWLNPPSDGSSPTSANRQSRTYRWDGQRFVQTGGPSSFPEPAPAKLTITATDLVYGPPDENGMRRGTMTVTITNTGGSEGQPIVTFPSRDSDEPEHTEWSDCRPLTAKPDGYRCLVEPLAPGKRKTYTFPFFTPTDAPPATATVRVDLADADGSALPSGGDQTTYLIKRST